MAEATARMHLRDTVRDDDVDTAISVLLESFIQAQKFSVRRSLEKGFKKYCSAGEDYNELLMRELHKLIANMRDYMRYMKRASPLEFVEVRVEDFEEKAHEFNIYDLSLFFKSKLFTSRFKLEADKGVISAPF